MPRVCTACRHPARPELDITLLANTHSLRALGARFGLSPSALRRHRDTHVPAALAKAASLDAIAQADSLQQHLRELRVHTLAVYARARESGDLKIELAALRELRSLAEVEAHARDKDPDAIDVRAVELWMRGLMTILREILSPEQIDIVLRRIGTLGPPRSANDTQCLTVT
jgi:hypothetical protein